MTHLLIACGGADQVRYGAPQSESELGQLILGAEPSEKEKYLSAKPAAQIRILSEQHGFYEVLSEDSHEELAKHFPSALIQKNEFYIKKQSTSDADTLTGLFAAQNFSAAQDLIDNTQYHGLKVIGEEINFQTCKSNGLKPVIKILPVSDNLKRRAPLEIGETVILDASQSQPHAFTGGDLKLSFVIESPLGSHAKDIYADQTLRLTLDTMGVYRILVVAQDIKSVCHVETAKLLVTGNEEFKPSVVAMDARVSVQKFLHKLELGQAHKKSTGQGVLIAVVDSGVNYNHPHLVDNIFINTKETDYNSDQDGNGYRGDIHGWDFVNNDPYPFDDNGHGSHIAGLAAGKLLGVAPDAKILPVKVSNAEAMSDLGTTLQGLTYAIEMGAKVINMSFGSYRPPAAIENRILKLAEHADVLLVAAAGNGDPNSGLGIDTDRIQHMPSGLTSPNLLSVAAVNEFDRLSYYSNFGSKSVHIATYGGEDFDFANRRPYDGMLYSTYIPNPDGLLFFPSQGTSMSTPIAVGIAALVFSYNSSLTAPEVSQILKQAGHKASALEGKILSGKVLTANSALDLAPVPTPTSTNLASQP